jgi:hypothetical protein
MRNDGVYKTLGSPVGSVCNRYLVSISGGLNTFIGGSGFL